MSEKPSRAKVTTNAPEPPKRGEVWWVQQNPIIPNDPQLPRPVVIVSSNPRNKNWDSVIVVPLSTGLQNPHSHYHKKIPVGAGGVPHDSHARCDLVSNLDKNCLDASGPLGPVLTDRLMWDIVRGIRAAVGDNPDL